MRDFANLERPALRLVADWDAAAGREDHVNKFFTEQRITSATGRAVLLAHFKTYPGSFRVRIADYKFVQTARAVMASTAAPAVVATIPSWRCRPAAMVLASSAR